MRDLNPNYDASSKKAQTELAPSRGGIYFHPESFNRTKAIADQTKKLLHSPLESSKHVLGASRKKTGGFLSELFSDTAVSDRISKLRTYGMWGGVAILGVLSLKSTLDFIKNLIKPEKGKKRFAVIKMLELLVGWATTSGIYNAVTRNGKLAFGSMKKLLGGIGAFTLIKQLSGNSNGSTNLLDKVSSVIPGAEDTLKDYIRR